MKKQLFVVSMILFANSYAVPKIDPINTRSRTRAEAIINEEEANRLTIEARLDTTHMTRRNLKLTLSELKTNLKKILELQDKIAINPNKDLYDRSIGLINNNINLILSLIKNHIDINPSVYPNLRLRRDRLNDNNNYPDYDGDYEDNRSSESEITTSRRITRINLVQLLANFERGVANEETVSEEELENAYEQFVSLINQYNRNRLNLN